MKNSDRIYNDMIDLWEKYNSHPFVQGLADGTLPKEKFKFFMIQDHLYLMQYAKVFAMGVLKSQKEEDMRLFADAFTGSTMLARQDDTVRDILRAEAAPFFTGERSARDCAARIQERVKIYLSEQCP